MCSFCVPTVHLPQKNNDSCVRYICRVFIVRSAMCLRALLCLGASSLASIHLFAFDAFRESHCRRETLIAYVRDSGNGHVPEFVYARASRIIFPLAWN